MSSHIRPLVEITPCTDYLNSGKVQFKNNALKFPDALTLTKVDSIGYSFMDRLRWVPIRYIDSETNQENVGYFRRMELINKFGITFLGTTLIKQVFTNEIIRGEQSKFVDRYTKLYFSQVRYDTVRNAWFSLKCYTGYALDEKSAFYDKLSNRVSLILEKINDTEREKELSKTDRMALKINKFAIRASIFVLNPLTLFLSKNEKVGAVSEVFFEKILGIPYKMNRNKLWERLGSWEENFVPYTLIGASSES